MIIYDDKTSRITNLGDKFLIQNIDATDDMIFKASYVIASDLYCNGKITALFDLIVLGNVVADEIEVKGRFICLGKCSIKKEAIIQNDMWIEEIQANGITCHDRIFAQSIDVSSVVADSNIVVAKTLAVEEKAKSFENVICGETAFGAGKIIANTIVTVEPLDLDDGEDALENPFVFNPESGTQNGSDLMKESVKYALTNDYSSYLRKLQLTPDSTLRNMFSRYKNTLSVVDKAVPDGISQLRDISILIWLIDIVNSQYFKGWQTLQDWLFVVRAHFEDVISGKVSIDPEVRPAKELEKGDLVIHDKYGKGIVKGMIKKITNGKLTQSAVVDFEDFGEKKFPLPDALKYFNIIVNDVQETEDPKSYIKCSLNSYSEWITALTLVYAHKEFFGKDLYATLNDILLSKIGLKAKFVEDRLKAKGWQ